MLSARQNVLEFGFEASGTKGPLNGADRADCHFHWPTVVGNLENPWNAAILKYALFPVIPPKDTVLERDTPLTD
jgi:hypothetical protein